MNLVVTLLVGMLSIRPTDSMSLQGCGEGATSIRGRIVGGKLSRQGMWPWQVGIHKQSIIDSSRYNIHCGGALIAPQWVLTAAHCFYTRRTSSSKIWHEKDITSLKRYKIISGDIDTQIREMSEQERFPIEVYIHPGYRHAPYYENDIALVKLNQTVTLGPLVRTVCLPISDVDFAKPGTVGTVAGWGRTRKSLISTVLKHTTIGIKDNAICKNATTYFFNKTVTFCAGDGNGRNDACQGDSGGSLVRSVSVNGKRIWVTVGLVSWGEGCGLPGKYGYYTRVHSFVDWINSSMLSCGNPGNIPFGRLIKAHRMKRFPMNFRVKYKCIDGYVLKGKSGRKCKGEGRWTRRPVCVREITCPDPGHPHNGVRRPSKGSYRYKTKIQFHCNRNHVMIGQSSLTCQIDGTWNDYPPLCLAPCQDPGVPENGIRWGINFKHGQMVRFACKKNSSMIGSPLITCFNGTWNRDTPKCFKVPTCMKPQLPVNTYSRSKLKERYRFNEIIMYACDYGYFTAGSRTQRCGARGKWSELRLKCIPKSCADPGTPKNGKRRGYVFTFKKKVYYECDFGYELIGPVFRQCQSNQKWSNDTPTCETVDCGRLATPKYGQKIEETKTTFLGRVTFQCNKKGYELKGSKQRVCRSNGRWDGTLTKCDPVECKDPGTPEKGGRNPDLDKYVFENKIRYSCKKNYTLKGDRLLICQDNKTWTGSKPKCLSPCPDPGIPKGGSRHHHSFLHGEQVTFSCKKGWKMEGEKNIVCNDGKWNYNAPRCLEGCTKPKHSPNGNVRPRRDFYYDDETVQMDCKWNYIRVGDSSARCRNGKWNNDPPSCKRKCNNPGSPYYGWKNGNKFFEDKQVSFRCTDGYDVIGLSIIQCLDTGRWSGSVPECKRRCSYRRPSNSKPSSNTALGRSLKHGTTIDHSCTNGYTLVGQKTIRCNDGRWRPSIPRCKAPCSDPGLISNGYQIGKTFTHHSILKYGCNNGYTLDSPGQLICDDGLWSRSVPSCKKLCDAPVTPQNGRRNGNNFKHGSQVSYRCYKNTKLVGSSRASCTNGKWSSQPPKCLEICSNLQGLANGNINRPNMKPLSGDKVTFSCNPHYDLVGNKAIFCDRGTWNGTVPQCVGNCRDVGKIRNAVVTKIKNRQGISRINGVVYKHGDRITIQCKDGFRVKGNPVLECKNGRWSDNKPSCIGVCRSLKAPQHGELRDFIFDYGSTVRFRCHHGYTLLKDQKIICNNGKWSNKEPVCKADCQDPGTPVNGQRQGHLFSHLQTVRFSCDKEFIMVGASSIQCRDGNWTRNKPVCAECGSPLGMENWEIPDENIQASSKLSWQYDAVYGRLNGRSSWCSSLIDRTPYLEIDLGKPYRITYLATQGGVRKWVSKYSVGHNLARSTFLKYRESSKEKLFIGNTDGTSIVKQKLKKPFIARKIKFHPIGVPLFGRAFNSTCMRVELYGCGLPNDCVMVGSRVLGRWVNYYHGGYIYYKAIVRTIDNNSAQLEIEDGNHDDDNFKSILKRNIVLDVPNKPINLTSGTRVLLPDRSYKYYTGTIGSGLHQDYYLVYPDYNKRRSVWRKKNEIRVLKPEEFCE